MGGGTLRLWSIGRGFEAMGDFDPIALRPKNTKHISTMLYDALGEFLIRIRLQQCRSADASQCVQIWFFVV